MNFVTSRYLAFSDTFEENEIYKRIIYSTRTSITALIEENIFQELLKNKALVQLIYGKFIMFLNSYQAVKDVAINVIVFFNGL